MKGFWKRFKIYLIGFSIGCLMVFFFFGNRGCSWLPSNRVMNSILSKVIVVQQSELDEASQNGISQDDIIQYLNTGDIEFGESEKSEFPKFYKMSFEKDGKTHFGQFSIMDESFVSEFKYLTVNEKVVTGFPTDGLGKIIRMPLDSNIVHISKNISQIQVTNPNTTSLQDALDDGDTEKAMEIINDSIAKENLAVQQGAALVGASTDEIQEGLDANGYIDFSKSHLKIPAKPEHYMVCTLANGKTIEFQAIWYKNKIEVNQIFKSAGE